MSGAEVVTAGAADLDRLSQVIAGAFHDLPPSRWLIPDPDARREIFPGYFRLHIQRALACGVVHTAPGRCAVALWIPAGEDPVIPPADYPAQLAAATGPGSAGSRPSTQRLTGATPPASLTTTWRSSLSSLAGKARGPALRCCAPITKHSTTRCAGPPTSKPPASALA